MTCSSSLGLKPKELQSLRSPLERCGAVVSRSIVYEEPHRHTSELQRVDQLVPEPAEGGGLEDLVVAGVRAAVLVPEAEVAKWFSWRWYWEDDLVGAAGRGRAARAAGGRVAGDFVIRELGREDAPAVARLELELVPDQVLTPELVWQRASRRIEREQLRTWVAELDGEMVAFAHASLRVVGADAREGAVLGRRASGGTAARDRDGTV